MPADTTKGMAGVSRPNTNNADEWQLWLLENKDASASYLAVQIAEAFDEISARSALLDRMQTVRHILTEPGSAVCVGGRFDGWLLQKHADGHWITVRRLDVEYPNALSPESR